MQDFALNQTTLEVSCTSGILFATRATIPSPLLRLVTHETQCWRIFCGSLPFRKSFLVEKTLFLTNSEFLTLPPISIRSRFYSTAKRCCFEFLWQMEWMKGFRETRQLMRPWTTSKLILLNQCWPQDWQWEWNLLSEVKKERKQGLKSLSFVSFCLSLLLADHK